MDNGKYLTQYDIVSNDDFGYKMYWRKQAGSNCFNYAFSFFWY